MASSTLPEIYAYEDIDGRKFWDGGLLSNTPIKELVNAHKRFWEKRIGSKNLENSFKEKREKEKIMDIISKQDIMQEQTRMQRIPDLELYIVNLLDPKEKNNSNTGTRLFLKISMELKIDILI